ncbi:MAG: putative DNA-binding domain-containing protein [Xanthobacteraceae bacterium]
MPALARVQSDLFRAVVAGEGADVAPLLVGGIDPRKRLAIHRRHYETSLVQALLGKFPATHWLVGSPFIVDAARDFVRSRPPTAPCIAEYGGDFPNFLSSRSAADNHPYLRPFVELEWHLGQVTIAVERPGLALDDVSAVAPEALMDMGLVVQPGVRYLRAPAPIDDLMGFYLTGSAPAQFQLAPADICLEVRGARGRFQIDRLDAGEFAFRKAILDGEPVGIAAERALDIDPAFDSGRSFVRLMTDRLVTATRTAEQTDGIR